MALSRRWTDLGIPVAILPMLVSMSAPLARGQEVEEPRTRPTSTR